MLQIFMSCCGLLFVQTLYDIFHTLTLRQYHNNNIKLFLCHLLSHYILLILLMNQIIYFHRQHIFRLLLDINHVWYLCLAAIMVFRPTNICIYNLARYGLKMKVFQILCITVMHAVCLCSPFCVSERGKLCHTYSMFMFQILCIRKRETVSYLQYVYVLDFVYQKEGNCIIRTICLCSRFCISERWKLYHTYIMFMIYTLCIRKRETVSYLQYVYDLDFLYQKEGNCVIPTVCS